MFYGLLSLPMDKARLLDGSRRTAAVCRDLDPATRARTQQLADAEGCDAKLVLLAAWQCLLSRWTGDVSADLEFRRFLRQVRDAGVRSQVDDAGSTRASRCRVRFAVESLSGSEYDLSLVANDLAGQQRFTFEYATDIFTAETIKGLADQYLVLLAGTVANPDTCVSRLPLVSEQERAALQRLWQQADAAAPPAQCIHELIAERARLAPDAIALAFGDERLSYGDLDRRADELAGQLVALGAGPDVLIGLCTDRSFDMVVGILGILKAGGVYLPLEPSLPSERLAFMIEDAAPLVILTQRGVRVRIPDTSATVLELDALPQSLASVAPRDVTPANLAYCIYTSGSTGRPKGVLVSHANVTRLLSTTQNRFLFDERDVWTLFHSFAFDFSVWELFGCLTYGGCLVIVPPSAVQSPDVFFDLLEEHAVTVLNMTPSAFRQLVTVAAERPLLESLRVVIFGGEAMYPATLAAWTAKYGWDRPALVNMYGITETTVHVTYRRLRASDATMPAKSPIGVPIGDLGITILDAGQAPVPRGIPGEMYVRGAGVARGYLNLPALTAERFVPDAYGGTARLYRTGDLARLNHAGELEYLGRCDEQVKLRGYRIELGEIEACLTSIHPVAEAAVSLVGNQLVAWLTAKTDHRLDPKLIRDSAAKVLPHYMIPAHFVEVPALPLNGNGKIDRRRLRELFDRARSDKLRFEPPTSETEIALAALWETVLDIRPIGTADNFFELGGDSLRAVELVRAAQEHGIAVTLTELLTSTCLRELAAKARVSGEILT